MLSQILAAKIRINLETNILICIKLLFICIKKKKKEVESATSVLLVVKDQG